MDWFSLLGMIPGLFGSRGMPGLPGAETAASEAMGSPMAGAAKTGGGIPGKEIFGLLPTAIGALSGLFGGGQKNQQQEAYDAYMNQLKSLQFPSGLGAETKIDGYRRERMHGANGQLGAARTRYAGGSGHGKDTNYGVERAFIKDNASRDIAKYSGDVWDEQGKRVDQINQQKMQGLAGAMNFANNLDVNSAKHAGAQNQGIMDLAGMVTKYIQGKPGQPINTPNNQLQGPIGTPDASGNDFGTLPYPGTTKPKFNSLKYLYGVNPS
jgi:hypothetical protein